MRQCSSKFGPLFCLLYSTVFNNIGSTVFLGGGRCFIVKVYHFPPPKKTGSNFSLCYHKTTVEARCLIGTLVEVFIVILTLKQPSVSNSIFFFQDSLIAIPWHTSMVDADEIARLCYERFSELPRRGKPEPGREWTLLAAVVKVTQTAGNEKGCILYFFCFGIIVVIYVFFFIASNAIWFTPVAI